MKIYSVNYNKKDVIRYLKEIGAWSKTELILNSPKLMASLKKSKDDVKNKRIKEHQWT